MELILIRHGTTQGNLERRFIGLTDIPVLPEGEELAREVSKTLPPVDHVYHSPLIRCVQTARLLWPGVEMTAVVPRSFIIMSCRSLLPVLVGMTAAPSRSRP